MEIKKRVQNAILSRIESSVEKYGRETTRVVLQRWCFRQQEKNKVEREIAWQQKKLAELQKKKEDK